MPWDVALRKLGSCLTAWHMLWPDAISLPVCKEGMSNQRVNIKFFFFFFPGCNDSKLGALCALDVSLLNGAICAHWSELESRTHLSEEETKTFPGPL